MMQSSPMLRNSNVRRSPFIFLIFVLRNVGSKGGLAMTLLKLGSCGASTWCFRARRSPFRFLSKPVKKLGLEAASFLNKRFLNINAGCIDTFVTGCIRLRGAAKSLDMIDLNRELLRTSKTVKMLSATQQGFVKLRRR